ncbi:MAG: hypothetical protein AB7S55_01840 [Thiomonas sp.]
MPVDRRFVARRWRATASFLLALAAYHGAAFAQPPLPTLTAGPDDVMRILPAPLLASLQPHCTAHRAATPTWQAQLDATTALLDALDQPAVPAAQATLPAAMLCPAHAPLSAAWRRATARATNLVKLDFPGAPALPRGASGLADVPAVSGISFIGLTGSRVLIVNRGTQPVRVRLGSWIGTAARLDQYSPRPGAGRRIGHVQRALDAADSHGIVLPPMSLSVIG